MHGDREVGPRELRPKGPVINYGEGEGATKWENCLPPSGRGKTFRAPPPTFFLMMETFGTYPLLYGLNQAPMLKLPQTWCASPPPPPPTHTHFKHN